MLASVIHFSMGDHYPGVWKHCVREFVLLFWIFGYNVHQFSVTHCISGLFKYSAVWQCFQVLGLDVDMMDTQASFQQTAVVEKQGDQGLVQL